MQQKRTLLCLLLSVCWIKYDIYSQTASAPSYSDERTDLVEQSYDVVPFYSDQEIVYRRNRFDIGKRPTRKSPRVIRFFGFTKEFEKTMSVDPFAYRIAKQAYPYQTLRVGGLNLLLLANAKELVDVLSSIDCVKSGIGPCNPRASTSLVNTVTAAGIAFFGMLKETRQIKKGIEAYNRRLQFQ